jgi:sortase (surface protein transpeptidase)
MPSAVGGRGPVAVPAPNPGAVDVQKNEPATQDQAEVCAAVEAAVAQQPGSRVRRTGRALLPVVLAALTGFVVAIGYLAIREPRPTGDVGRWGNAGATAQAPAPAMPELPWGVSEPFGTPVPELHGVPTRLRVEAIGVDTPLQSLRLSKDGGLDAPKDSTRAGWYADGTIPGDVGPAVIAGHVDDKRGPAVFYRLRELEAGDRIEVVRGGTTVRFTVTSMAWYPKTAFPSATVYGPTPDRELRLITCGGVFDHHLRSYRDNFVVYAAAG